MSRNWQDPVEEVRRRNVQLQSFIDTMDDRGIESVNDMDTTSIKSLRRLNDEISELVSEIDANGYNQSAAIGQFGGMPPQRNRSIGDQLLRAPEFKSFVDSITTPNRPGYVESRRFGQSPPIEIKGFLDQPVHGGIKSVIHSGDASAGPLVQSDRLGLLDQGAFRRPLNIRDILTTSETTSDTVEYARVLSETNAAAPTAEPTSVSTGAKPESAATFELVTETVKTIAHWIPASRRILADAKQLRGWLNTYLRYGLEEELEDQIVQGSGAGENYTGILNTSGISTQAFDTNIIRTAREARTKVRTLGRARPTAYLMHPLDWEAFDLAVDNEERYHFGGPAAMGVPRLWGLPVIDSEAVPQGTAIVADFRLAVLWDQDMAKIYVSDSHSDFFTRNLIALLAEMRGAFGVLRPKAFVSFALS